MHVPLAEIDFIDSTDDEEDTNEITNTSVASVSKANDEKSPSSNLKIKFQPRKFIFDASYVETNRLSTSKSQDSQPAEASRSPKSISTNKKSSNLKMKFVKMLHQSLDEPPLPTPEIKAQVKVKPGGILKSIFSKSTSRKPSADLDQSQTSITTATSDTPNDSSFNALTVKKSPVLTRNHTRYSHPTPNSVNNKRTQMEDLKLEKNQRDRRLRMSQEIQRKLDEVENKIAELEFEGVNLEKSICLLDISESDAKEKMEQELYNLIHLKNLLTRVENDLTIQ